MNENLPINRPTAYSVWMDIGNGFDYHCVVYCQKRSQVRYAYFKRHDLEDCGYDYRENFLGVRLRINKLGNPVLKDLFKNETELAKVSLQRGVPFVELGMKVFYYGKTGFIIGSNNAQNLDVYFPEKDTIENCHPNFSMTYFDIEDEMILCTF